MNVNSINDFFKAIGVFLMMNIIGILFLFGLGVLIYAFFRMSINTGFFALGTGLVIVSLILAREGR